VQKPIRAFFICRKKYRRRTQFAPAGHAAKKIQIQINKSGRTALMTYAEKLKACRDARIRCANTCARIEGLEDSIDLAERGIEKPHITSGLIAKIDFYEKELEAEWDLFDIFQEQFMRLKDEAEEFIKPLPPAWQKLLELRYIKALDWESIYGRLPYEKDKCRRMHEEAIEALKFKENLE
jgi:hypothetical protein